MIKNGCILDQYFYEKLPISIFKKLYFHTKWRRTKKILWGGNQWTIGYYANTVGQYGNKDVIRKYIENQGKEKGYKKIHGEQLKLCYGID